MLKEKINGKTKRKRDITCSSMKCRSCVQEVVVGERGLVQQGAEEGEERGHQAASYTRAG